MVDIARQHVLLGASTGAARRIWACDRHCLDGVEAGVASDRAAPPRHILMPLYPAGLCDAVKTAPGMSSTPDA